MKMKNHKNVSVSHTQNDIRWKSGRGLLRFSDAKSSRFSIGKEIRTIHGKPKKDSS